MTNSNFNTYKLYNINVVSIVLQLIYVIFLKKYGECSLGLVKDLIGFHIK